VDALLAPAEANTRPSAMRHRAVPARRTVLNRYATVPASSAGDGGVGRLAHGTNRAISQTAAAWLRRDNGFVSRETVLYWFSRSTREFPCIARVQELIDGLRKCHPLDKPAKESGAALMCLPLLDAGRRGHGGRGPIAPPCAQIIALLYYAAPSEQGGDAAATRETARNRGAHRQRDRVGGR
jgi:hypothetical protein